MNYLKMGLVCLLILFGAPITDHVMGFTVEPLELTEKPAPKKPVYSQPAPGAMEYKNWWQTKGEQ